MNAKLYSKVTILILASVLSWPGKALADVLPPMAQAAVALPLRAAGPGDQTGRVDAAGRFADPNVRVVESNAQGVVLELVTPDWRVKQDNSEDGRCDLITLPGYGETNTAGWPRLPVKGVMVAIPPQAKPTLAVLEVEPAAVPQRYNLCPVPRLDYEQDPFSAEIKNKGTIATRDAEAYSSSRFYPADLAVVVSTGQVRDRYIVQLQFHPFQINSASGELKYYRRIRVQVQFGAASQQKANGASAPGGAFDQMLEQVVANYDAVAPASTAHAPRAALAASSTSSQPAYRITVNQNGLYRVTYAELQAAGIDVSQLDPRILRLSNQGQPVAIYVEGEQDGAFDPDDALYFYGQKMNTRYTDANVYWLTWGGANGLRMPALDGTPGGASVPAHFLTTQRVERDSIYYSYLSSGPDGDRWYWDYISASGAPAFKSFTTSLQSVATTPLSVTVRGLLNGFSAAPQHHTQVYLNGRLIDDALWLPKAEHSFQASVPQAYLIEGTNTISVACPMDNGVTQDVLAINRFEIDYHRLYAAEDDRLAFDGDAPGAWNFQVGGFTTNTLSAFDLADPARPARILSATVTPAGGAYALTFQQTITGEHHYLALASAQAQSVLSIEADRPSDLRAAANGADYIILTHGSFYTDVLPLAAYRAAQGLRTAVVDVQDVYDEFNGGIFSPLALRDFLAYAYANWTPPAPTYVLLVGDGNWDYKNNLGASEPNYIPPYLADVDPWLGETAADNQYACVSGSDSLPDLYIGRLPVRTGAEAAAVVAKILDYEQNPAAGDWNRQVLFPADNPDGAGNFYWYADVIADYYLPAPYTAQKIYYGQTYTNPAQDRAAIIGAINEGRLIVNYVGHGSIQYWASEQLFRVQDVAALTNTGRLPLLVTMACYDGYFDYPNSAALDYSSMSETMVRAAGKGAIASWATTGMGLAGIQDLLNRGLYQALFDEDVTRLGPATTLAKLYLYDSIGGYNHEIDSYTLFGDPALQLNVLPSDAGIAQKVDAPEPPRPGDALTYTLVYSNAGPVTARHVVISDSLSTELIGPAVVSSGASITARPGSHFVWDVADLGAGAGGVITVTGALSSRLPAGSLLSHTAAIATATIDADPGNDNSVATVAVSDQSICRLSTGQYSFNLTTTVQIAISAVGSLDCLTVERFDAEHPGAAPNIQTERYWRITGTDAAGGPASGFSMTLTLPTIFTPNINTKVCRYTGVDNVWDCAAADYDELNNTVTRYGVTTSSDWAVGNNNVPTAVALEEFRAISATGSTLPQALVGTGLGVLAMWLWRRLCRLAACAARSR